MTKEEYEKLPKQQKNVFRILFSGGFHSAKNIRYQIGDDNLNVSTIVKALAQKDEAVCYRWRYTKGVGYYKIYYYKKPGEWKKQM